jgi:hypothetical protein
MSKLSKNWLEYPKVFQDALGHFENSIDPWIYRASRRDCFTMKTQFYRFFEQVRKEYKEVDEKIRTQTGLDKAYHFARQLIPSVREYNGGYFLELRMPSYADEFVVIPPAVAERLAEMAKVATEKMLKPKEDYYDGLLKKAQEDHKRIESEGPSIGQPPEQQTTPIASEVVICPNTERPCRRRCQVLCNATGEKLKGTSIPG